MADVGAVAATGHAPDRDQAGGRLPRRPVLRPPLVAPDADGDRLARHGPARSRAAGARCSHSALERNRLSFGSGIAATATAPSAINETSAAILNRPIPQPSALLT